jgi:hypothetical protein
MSGAASSIVIKNIAVKAIKALKKKGAIVNNVFCGGLHLLKEYIDSLAYLEKWNKTNIILNILPTLTKNSIFFFYVPHIMKCIRNHIFTP